MPPEAAAGMGAVLAATAAAAMVFRRIIMKLRNGKYYLTLTGEVGGVTRARARELLLMFNVKIIKNGRWEVRIDFVELFNPFLPMGKLILARKSQKWHTLQYVTS